MHDSTPGNTSDDSGRTIGEIVAADYRTAGVFENHGVDFCCGGNVALAAACELKGLNIVSIIAELDAVKREPLQRSQNYASWELPFVTDYIINIHHTYFKENTGKICASAYKIASVHGTHHPEVIKIAAIFDKVAADMGTHLREEEEVFFPAIKRAYATKAAGSAPVAEDIVIIKTLVTQFRREHEVIGDAIHTIRHLTNEYAIPRDVCNTFVATYQKFKEFEDDLHKHVHLENNILFVKALQL